jgi:hypothetical protein
MIAEFAARLTPEQLALWESLDSPAAIQAFLDTIPYSAEDVNRSPLRVLRERRAHCLDGAIFAAAALRRLGQPAVIVDLLPEPGTDDDHVIAIYKREGLWGAIAKSNFTGLRFREAIHRTLRELVLSYFEAYFNVLGQKTLRSYTLPLNLERLDTLHWMWDDAGVDAIERRLGSMRRVSLVTPAMAQALSPVDGRSYQAGLLGADLAGLYQPRQSP